MADRFQEPLPEWDNVGTKPADEVIDAGWQIGDKPPASWWNWLSNRVYKCLQELREYITGKEASKDGVPTYTTTGTSSNYVVTSNPPVETPVNGMVFFIRPHAENTIPTTLTVDSVLTNIPVLKIDNTVLNSGDLRQNYVYMVMYYNNQFYVLDYKQALLSPIVNTQRLNLIMNEGQFLIKGNGDMPLQVDSDVNCLLDVCIYRGLFANYRRQTVTVLNSNIKYVRDLNLSTGAVIRDWKISQWTDKKSQVRNSQLFQNFSRRGLDISVSGSSYSLTVGEGVIYSNDNGMLFNDSLITVTDSDPGNSGDTKYLVINVYTNEISIVASATSGLLAFATLTVGATGFDSYTHLYSSYKLVAYVEAQTPPDDDATEKIANTVWVKNYVDNHSGGGGAGKVYFVAVVGSAAAGYTVDDVDYLCDGTNDADQIQAALNTTPAGTVKILPGDYTLNHSVNIPSGACLYGESDPNRVTLRKDFVGTGNINGSLIVVTAPSDTWNITRDVLYGVTLRAIDQSEADPYRAAMVYFNTAGNVEVRMRKVIVFGPNNATTDNAAVYVPDSRVIIDGCAIQAGGNAVGVFVVNGVLFATDTYISTAYITASPAVYLNGAGSLYNLTRCIMYSGGRSTALGTVHIRGNALGSNYVYNSMEDCTINGTTTVKSVYIQPAGSSFSAYSTNYINCKFNHGIKIVYSNGSFNPAWHFLHCQYGSTIGVDLTEVTVPSWTANTEISRMLFDQCDFDCSVAGVALNPDYPRASGFAVSTAVVFNGCTCKVYQSGSAVMYQSNPNVRLMAVNNIGWKYSGTLPSDALIANNL